MTAALFPYKKETGFACIQIKPVKKSHVYGGKTGIRTLLLNIFQIQCVINILKP